MLNKPPGICCVLNCTQPIAGLGVEKCKKHLVSPLATRTAARPYIDYDYMERLSPKDREWLKTFTRQYYGSSKHSIASSRANDSRRRCYPLQKGERLTQVNTPHSDSPEDALIDYLDGKKP